jgi:mannose-6-phosphate isomerase
LVSFGFELSALGISVGDFLIAGVSLERVNVNSPFRGLPNLLTRGMMPYLQFDPIYQERVWGGRALAQHLGRTLPASGSIGESWEIVDRPEAQSVVRGGPFAGRTLRQLIQEKSAEIMGRGWPAVKPFPILVKWLDCRERLSLQVHPPASVAAGLGGEPKTENWYIAQAEKGSAVLAGLKPGVTPDDFERALKNNSAEQLVERHATRAGDSLLIHSGVMHAIDAGNLILEIQQNSDTTYRVYDWGRVGLDGKPRTLHIPQSMASLRANTAGAPHLVRASGKVTVLAQCDEFRITEYQLADRENLHFRPDEQPKIFSVVEGVMNSDGNRLERGANVLLPFAGDFALVARGDATVLVTDHFNRH